MWLLPAFSRVSNVISRVFYRMTVAGHAVPARTPLLLVANHSNSLLDPALVIAAAGRPVRFLAKATLFANPLIGWVFRAVGAIPVYRRADDPALLKRNVDTFRAAHAVLAGAGAVGIFPEGYSHRDPSIAPLKTGAARLALGAFATCGTAFPILPVGLLFRDPSRFRTGALVLIGDPVPWEDIAAAGVQDADAVRELTRRIDAALRAVTVNLERWEDASMVECAEGIYAAEFGAATDPADWVVRLRYATEALAWLRTIDDPRWTSLAKDVRHHARLLRLLQLRPIDLHRLRSDGGATRRVRRRLPLVVLLGIMPTLVASAVFWVPYRLTRIAAKAFSPRPDVRSTTKVLCGVPIFGLWIVALSVLVWRYTGLIAGLATLLLLPVGALVSLRLLERWRDAWREVGHMRLLLRKRSELLQGLQTRQHEIAVRLQALSDAFVTRTRQPGARRFDAGAIR